MSVLLTCSLVYVNPNSYAALVRADGLQQRSGWRRFRSVLRCRSGRQQGDIDVIVNFLMPRDN